MKGFYIMSTKKQKAILVVSFGTSYADTREKNIDQIEKDIAAAYPDYAIYRAWTSKMILKKIKERDGISIPTVKEAMEQIIVDGITELVVQPTHVINGIENDIMKEEVLLYKDRFSSIRFGSPLLTSTEDNEEVIKILMEEIKISSSNEILIFMGHGTSHYANSVYAALDYTFKDKGYENVFIGTVESYPSLDTLAKFISKKQPAKILLAPFMIVAGDHARNDMAGDDEDSWKKRFEAEGFQVSCILKGLGEYKGIREMFVQHVADAIEASFAC